MHGTVIPVLNYLVIVATQVPTASMDGPARLAWNVRRLRLARGLTQEVLAVDAGLVATQVNGIERGRANPTLKVIGQLAIALGVTVDEFFQAPEPGSAPLEPMRAGRKPKGSASRARRTRSKLQSDEGEKAHDQPADEG